MNHRIHFLWLFPLAVFLRFTSHAPAEEPPRYRNPALPTSERVDDLVGRMTLTEKVGQMMNDSPAIARLGIPAYDWWSEGLHGVLTMPSTVFPEPIGLAATFDLPLETRVATAISDEARAWYNKTATPTKLERFHGLTYFSPNINIFRDPRWGRGQETYGEDPYLTSQFGDAFIRALQGDDPKYLKLVATAKHYAVHSGPEAERHQFDAVVSDYDLHDTYLPAFESAVRDAHVYSVMSAYNRINGYPASVSPILIKELLRDQWGFQGYVISDYGAVDDIFAHHKYTKSLAEADALSVKNGTDLTFFHEYDALPLAVQQGLISEQEIDVSVKRLFTARMKLGMFDPPGDSPYAKISPSIINGPEHRKIALDAAHKSMVLLKNDGALLPLSEKIKTLAVIGPNADDIISQSGNYNNGPSPGSVSVLAGLRRRAATAHIKVEYAKGCELLGREPASPAAIAEAVAVAQRADAVIVVGGISSLIEGEEGVGDRATLDLPPAQAQLLQALHATGKPIVLVLMSGSALSVNWANEHVPAILQSWYAGAEGGTAVADVLFGDYNPAGRLPVTFYKSVDQLPDFHDYAMKHRTYRYFEGEPLYPFGYGLSYTQFRYSDFVVPAQVKAGEPATVRVKVTNGGDRDGEEVVQLYLRPAPQAGTREVFPGQPMPRLILAGFQRIPLAAQASRTVEFALTPAQLLLVNAKGERAFQPGSWQVFVGGGQPALGASAAPTNGPLSAMLTVP